MAKKKVNEKFPKTVIVHLEVAFDPNSEIESLFNNTEDGDEVGVYELVRVDKVKKSIGFVAGKVKR